MKNINGRHELKFNINETDIAILRARLRIVAKADENAIENGRYKINSLYFDNYNDKAVFEKLSGQSKREKFRLRYYNNDTSFIRLEKKSKINRLVFKESTMINQQQCERLLDGDYKVLLEGNEQLFLELYSKITYQNLRPKSIVVYTREAYTYEPGNVRITFDTDIRASNNVLGFLNEYHPTIPSAKAMVLEVKHDAFLPNVIRDMLQIGWRNQSEFSKYTASRII
ncbi:MAG: polyphosphate polymerase domain-containing protein [Oscillospiraceae bacterium]|nr:polyphosphate polymerase domain-containing protein [Oscillospiraceae bacterium]